MKKIFTAVLITITILALIGCNNSKYEEMRCRYNADIHNASEADTSGLRVSEFEYKNHQYLMFTSPWNSKSPSVVHNPDCKCKIDK